MFSSPSVCFFPQHYVEGLLNSRPRVESVHTEIAIFGPPPCTGRILITIVPLHTETPIKKYIVFGRCFVTNEVPWRFQKLSMPPSESSPRDLQSGNGPGASGAQKNMKIYENIGKYRKQVNVFFFRKK
mgnify:CR=1 FL=1